MQIALKNLAVFFVASINKVKVIFLILFFSVYPFAQESAKQDKATSIATPVVIPKFSNPPLIDGKLDDDIWKSAAVFKDFVQIRPNDNLPASKETVAYAGYDEKNLYFGIMCFDEADKIRASVANRDDVGDEDNVRITLDTFNDQRRAYFLLFNPLGIQGDGILTDGFGQGGPDLSVDIVMESKGVILENGWSVEVRVPFKSLRYEAGKGKFWGFNVSRSINRLNNELDSWSPIERGVPNLRQIGKITGLDDIKTERTLEIIPNLIVSETGERVLDVREPGRSRLVNRPPATDLGVSVKFQITPNVTLDAAINPDFAEVETDAPVVLANQRFPIFFPERRPFFLEGNDFFRTPLQVVNTRAIADPDVALKLTGKIGRNIFGVFSAVDRFANNKTKAYVGVARLRRDIGDSSSLGAIATTYHFGSRRHNNLFGVDGRFQIGKLANFNFQVVGTNSRRTFFNPNINQSEFRTGNGFAYNINYDYTGRNRGFTFGINGRSRDFRADVGFVRRTDTHSASGGFRIGTEPNPKKTLIGVTTRTFFNAAFDEQGRVQQLRASFNTEWILQNQLSFNTGTDFEVSKIYEDEFGARRNATQEGRFFGENFRKGNQFTTDAEIGKTFNKRLSIGANIGVTTNDFDFDFGASERYPRVSPFVLSSNPQSKNKLDPGKGLNFGYGLNLDLLPVDALGIIFTYDRERLRRNDNKLTAFDSNIFSMRSTYQFTRFTFARARIDYETVGGSINTQLLLGWSPNPGTAFYVGYNDNSNYRGFNDFSNNFDTGFRQDARRFFIRMSYLFRRSF